MKLSLSLVFVLLVASLSAGSAFATLFTPTSDPVDREIGIGNGNNGTNVGLTLAFVGDSEMRAGNNNPDFGRQDSAIILVFELPAIPSGEEIVTASLTSDVWRHFLNGVNTDLYGVRSDLSNTVVLGDYGFGPTPGPGTLIQDDVYTPAIPQTAWTSVSTDAGGDAALASWLDDQYTAVGAGGYAFIRLQLDATTTTALYYKVPSGDNTAGLNLPTLSITTAVTAVPEPSAFFMVGLTSLVIYSLKKKRAGLKANETAS